MTAQTLPHRSMAPTRNPKILPDGMLGMLIFTLAELMLFAGLVSAFTIARAGALAWPPPGQPRLPVGETAFNSAALLASGWLLFQSSRAWRVKRARMRGPVVALGRPEASVRTPFVLAILLGVFFVAFQGAEWAALLAEGLTLTSSVHGSFFYLIIGLHALHAVAALILLGYAYLRLVRGGLTESLFGAAQVFWYFVVGVWPVLYWRVYL